MTKRNKLLVSYLVTMCALTVVRICFSEQVFGELKGADADRLFTALTQLVCMGVVPLCALAFTSEQRSPAMLLKRVGFKPFGGKRAVLLVIAISVLHVVINGGVSTVWSFLIRSTGYIPVVSDPEVYLNFGEFLLGVLFTAVLPGIFEEITHRGLALRMTGESRVKSVLLTSLLFALMHQNIMQTGYTFVGGLMFGALTVITGSIFPAMIAHATNNLCVVIRIYAYSGESWLKGIIDGVIAFSGTTLGAIAMTALWIGAVVLCIYLFVLLYRDRTDVVTESEDEENSEQEYGANRVVSCILWVAIIVLGTLTTLFSYIWGLMR